MALMRRAATSLALTVIIIFVIGIAFLVFAWPAINSMLPAGFKSLETQSKEIIPGQIQLYPPEYYRISINDADVGGGKVKLFFNVYGNETGRPVSDFSYLDFELKEDDVVRSLSNFRKSDGLYMLFLVDISKNAADLDFARQIINNFISRNSNEPNVKAAVYGFNKELAIQHPWVSPAELSPQLDGLQLTQEDAYLWDALGLASANLSAVRDIEGELASEKFSTRYVVVVTPGIIDGTTLKDKNGEQNKDNVGRETIEGLKELNNFVQIVSADVGKCPALENSGAPCYTLQSYNSDKISEKYHEMQIAFAPKTFSTGSQPRHKIMLKVSRGSLVGRGYNDRLVY